MRILLVDDERINILSASKMLERHGHEVTTAVNGAQALEKLAEGDFDCVLMDLQMPVMDGLEASGKIRDRKTFGDKADIPIIAMTGHSYDDAKEDMDKAGLTLFVSKPFDMNSLLAALEKAAP
ncbi:response regulator [Maridesulfovibrio sp.]|uniref:response regulator n=1 Tax=Maridesulfovibrio sp. TaxID=2795000 RepID=UPI002A18A637|nr:response regulator [Maridesulfovibrio sp.]